MTKTLILISHPDFTHSRANRALAEAASQLAGVEIAHLDALYPQADIDVDAEVARLIDADSIVLQFPVQWYSTPPVLKAWQDTVLTRMFYINPETEGARLAGRPLLVAATAGNNPAAYSAHGINLFPLPALPALLQPLHAMANRCGLVWHEPFLLFEAKTATGDRLAAAGRDYADRLRRLTAANPATAAQPPSRNAMLLACACSPSASARATAAGPT